MVDKKQQSVSVLQKIQTLALWQLVVLLALMSIAIATLLRMNNVRMIERKQAVISADRSGDLGMLNERLYDLQGYVIKHMNASTGRIFSETLYRQKINQLINDAKKTINSQSGQNAYKTASEICDRRFRGYSQAYAECFLAEVNKQSSVVPTPVEIKTLSPNLYTVSYASPHWSPDLAGFAVLIWGLLALLLVLKLVFWLGLKLFIGLK